MANKPWTQGRSHEAGALAPHHGHVQSAHEIRKHSYAGRMSDHIAYALLVYTGLQIFMTVQAMKTSSGSILPYLALVVLVAAIIPWCRKFEKRWERLDGDEAHNAQLDRAFTRDRVLLWASAIGLPVLITLFLNTVSGLFA
jgi:hypothetical protein